MKRGLNPENSVFKMGAGFIQDPQFRDRFRRGGHYRNLYRAGWKRENDGNDLRLRYPEFPFCDEKGAPFSGVGKRAAWCWRRLRRATRQRGMPGRNGAKKRARQKVA